MPAAIANSSQLLVVFYAITFYVVFPFQSKAGLDVSLANNVTAIQVPSICSTAMLDSLTSSPMDGGNTHMEGDMLRLTVHMASTHHMAPTYLKRLSNIIYLMLKKIKECQRRKHLGRLVTALLNMPNLWLRGLADAQFIMGN